MRVVLKLDKEKERVLLSSLHLYKDMVVALLRGSTLQREIARYEEKMVHELLTQLLTVKEMRAMLPTIAPVPQKK
jgi:hypothetical protein